jgi:hypothetical protein
MLRLRAATVPLVLSVWQTAVLAQAQAPAQAAQAAPMPAAAPASTQTPAPTETDAAGSPLPASVVPPPRKPQGNGALFGATDTLNVTRPLAIDATLSVSGAYDDDLSEGQSTSPLVSPVGGEYSDLTPALSLSRKLAHTQFTARAATSLRHYPSLHRFVGSSYSAGGDLRTDLSPRTTVQAGVDGTYISEFAFDTVGRQSGLGNVALSSAGLDVTALDRARISYGASAGISHKVGLHTQLAFTAGVRDSERPVVNEVASEQSVGSHLSRAVGRDTSISVNYTVRRYSERFGGAALPAWSNEVGFGFEQRWRHSAERRTVLDLSFGPSLLSGLPTASVPQPATPPAQTQVSAVPAASHAQFNAVGSAALSHDMSRSWNLATTFRRGAGSIDGFVSDAATFDLRGLVTRRVELIESAGWFRTALGGGTTQNRYSTRYASSRIQLALSRGVAVYGQYLLYDFDFGSGGLLPPDVSPLQHRRGARAGITLWAPLHEGR